MLVLVADRSPRESRPLLGLLTTAELLAEGVGPSRIRTLVRRGSLVVVRRGVYGYAGVVSQARALRAGDCLLQTAAALAAIGPGAVASHHTAAVLHGVDLLGRGPAYVTTTRSSSLTSRSAKPGMLVHYAGLPAGHVTQQKGVPVTTVARTVIDLARTSSFRAGVVTADNALHRGRTTKDELSAVLADCRRWRGIRAAAAVVEFADRKSESALESVARVVFRDLGLPPPELQVWLGRDEDAVRVDFLWRRYRTVVEVDGAVNTGSWRRSRHPGAAAVAPGRVPARAGLRSRPLHLE